MITLVVDQDLVEAEKISNKLFQIDEDSIMYRFNVLKLAYEGKEEESLEEMVRYGINYRTKGILKARLGMTSEALSDLEQAIKGSANPYSGDLSYLTLKDHPFYENIRQESEFQQWLKEAKVVHDERVQKYSHLFND